MNVYLVAERPRLAAAFALLVGLFAANPAQAQLVVPRTVPVFQDEQFEIYPSSRPGLGGVSIALDDSLADPFGNPAKALRLRGATFLSAPFSHGISGNRGGGRTLPIAFMGGNGVWAGAVLGAMQELDRAGPTWNLPSSERQATNQYVAALLARRLGRGLSVGVSGFHADLGAIDGVDLLYAGSDRIQQDGSVDDVRLGMTKEWSRGHSLDVMLLHNRTHMRHDVHFTQYAYVPALRISTMTQREEVNLDQTNIWGAHTEYVRRIGHEGWRIGAIGTVNKLEHPKIPNYVIQNIPRDPGTTWAYNAGIGIGRVAGPLTLGADLILEPMRSTTWADQANDVTRTDGTVLRAGERTIENHFTFRNSKARLGIGRAFATDRTARNTIAVNLGLDVYAISYDLRQQNNITGVLRRQHEHWVESGPAFGLRFKSRDVEISYAFKASCGSSGGCVDQSDQVFLANASTAASSGGIIAAPSSTLFIQQGRETSHHFTVAVPIR